MGIEPCKAWNADGALDVTQGIPLGAVRKAILNYKNIARTISKLIMNGVVFDITKQKREGLVVMGPTYNPITFFLPDYREPMSAADGEALSYYGYLELLATTDYCEIPAWDHFAAFVGELIGQSPSVTEDVDAEELISNISYTINGVFDGTASFVGVTTARDFFNVIFNSIDEAAKSYPLSYYMEEDGAVIMVMTIHLGTDDSGNPIDLPLSFILGRK